MGTLTGLIKLAMSAILANKAFRGALTGSLARSIGWFTNPSTRSKVNSFVYGAGAKAASGTQSSPFMVIFQTMIGLMLFKYKKIRWIAQFLAFSGLGALLLNMLRKNQTIMGDQSHSSSRSEQKGQTIEVDDYSVMEEDR